MTSIQFGSGAFITGSPKAVMEKLLPMIQSPEATPGKKDFIAPLYGVSGGGNQMTAVVLNGDSVKGFATQRELMKRAATEGFYGPILDYMTMKGLPKDPKGAPSQTVHALPAGAPHGEPLTILHLNA